MKLITLNPSPFPKSQLLKKLEEYDGLLGDAIVGMLEQDAERIKPDIYADEKLVQERNPLSYGAVTNEIPHAPAGHGIGLGKALDEQDAVAQLGKRRKAPVVRRIAQLAVHVVADNEYLPLRSKPAHRLEAL